MKKLIALSLIIALSAIKAEAFNTGVGELLNEKRQQKHEHRTLNSGVTDYRVSTVNIDWWENFTDPYLKEYICLAIKRNHDLKIASLKSEEYRQMVKQTFAGELPTLNFLPTFLRIKTAANQIEDIQFAQTRTNVYALPLFASYEADIFLKNHDKTKAAKKKYEAAEYEEKAAYIEMAANVAALYINILKLDKIINTQNEIVNIRLKISELTKDRNKAGLASTYDVTYTDKLHTISQIALNDLKKQREIYLHQLAVYIDFCPTDNCELKRGKFDALEYKGKIPDCISSEIALQRPDLMKAEADLKKAKIDVKIARKDFLPTIPIFGSVAYNSLQLRGLFDWENIAAFVGVAAVTKLYTGGRLMASLRIKKLQFEELFEKYKQADLTAIQEINDSLVMIKFDTKKDNDNLKKLTLEKNNFGLINERYKAGIISYLEMIQYKETLLTLQTEKDNSKALRLTDYITLYKATGTKL